MELKDFHKQYGFIGHYPQMANLRKIASKFSHHAGSCFMFAGPEGSGKLQVARWFSKEIAGKDVTEFTYTGAENLEAFQQIFADTGFGSRVKGKVRAFIFDIQKPLTYLIANALLKSLEEVNGGTTIILVVPDASYLLTTISSRAKAIEFSGLPQGEALWILQNVLKFSEANAQICYQCYGTNLKLATTLTIEETIEGRDYVYEKFQEISSGTHMFIEIEELAGWFPTYFEHYRAILLNWAKLYLNDSTHGPRFSRLSEELMKLKADLPNLNHWVQRAFIRYSGWQLPAIATSYETIQ